MNDLIELPYFMLFGLATSQTAQAQTRQSSGSVVVSKSAVNTDGMAK